MSTFAFRFRHVHVSSICWRPLQQPTKTHFHTYPGGSQAPGAINLSEAPNSKTSRHDSLSSFLHYAERSSLDARSTTYTGTLYEYVVVSTLARYAMELTRVGGRSDAGIDLLGHWNLPSSVNLANEPVPVIIQCKNLSRRPSPVLLREVDGAFNGAPTGWRGERTLGILAATREATKGLRDAIGHSRNGIVFFMIELVRGETAAAPWVGRVRQCLWNRRAGELGLGGVETRLRYLLSPTASEIRQEEVVLSYKGQRIGSDDVIRS